MMQAPADAGASSKPTVERASRSKKRERPETLTNNNSNGKLHRPEKTLRSSHIHGERDIIDSEATSLTGKDGGLRDLGSVDKLLWLMEQDTTAKHTDLAASRAKLCKILSCTKDFECLNKFVKIGGLSVLGRWLHEDYNRRKLSEDGYGEEMLLSVLRALEILPVDYSALKRSAIGRSVNLLRNHKSHELQRISKKLVETWKKQVEAEMQQSSQENQSLSLQELDMASSRKANRSNESCPFEPTIGTSGIRGRHSASVSSSPENHRGPSSSSSPHCSVDTQSRSFNNLDKPSTDAVPSRPRSRSGRTTRNGSNKNGCNVSEACNTPSSSSSPCSPENFDISQRIKGDNAASSCRSEVTEHRSFVIAAADTGINLLAQIAVSESSISDHKSAESQSDKTSSSICRNSQEDQSTKPSVLWQPSPINQKDGGQHVHMAGVLMDVDRSSSTVSSPSDTTVVVETSTSSQPDARASTLPSQSSGQEDLMRRGSPNGRHFTHQPNEPEVVGDSTVGGFGDRNDNPHGSASAVKESTSMSRSCGDDPLEVARQVAMEVQQEIAERECSERPSSAARSREEAMTSSPHQMSCPVVPTVFPNKPTPATSSEVTAKGVDVSPRPFFDLNESLNGEDTGAQEVNVSVPLPLPANTRDLPTTTASTPSHVISPVTVVVGSKGAFIPPVIPPRPAGEPGWRGSAATSAFRPTRPRTAPATSDKPVNASPENPAEASECAKPILDFDLNISADSPADVENEPRQPAVEMSENSQKVCEPSKRPFLDLNQADEESLVMENERTSTDQAQCSRPELDLNDGGGLLQDQNEFVSNKQAEFWNGPRNGMPMHLRGIQQSMLNENSSMTIPAIFATPSRTAPNPTTTSIPLPTYTTPSNTSATYPPTSNSNGAWGNAGFNVYLQGPSGMPSSNMLYHQYTVPMPASYGGFQFSITQPPKEANKNQSGGMQSVPQPMMMRPQYTSIQNPQRSGTGWTNLDLNAGPEAGGDSMSPPTTSRMMYDQLKVHPMSDSVMCDQRKMQEAVGMYDPRIVPHPVMNDAAAAAAMAMSMSSSPYMISREGAATGPWAMQGAAILPKQAGGR